MVDPVGQNGVRINKGPGAIVDVGHADPAMESKSDSAVDIRLVGPRVVRPVAVVPARRNPADVAGTKSPVHPGVRVGRAGNPEPAIDGRVRPASVVIRHPAPGLVRHPYQRSAAMMPPAVVIRPPADRDVRTPGPAVVVI